MENKKETHPSYGMVQISRISAGGADGGLNLFGSAMKHGNAFVLRITEGERSHNLSQDDYYGHDSFIEIYLSPSQFVSMITTMNIGSGIPCTISRFNGESIEDCPPQTSEGERIREAFKSGMKETAAELAKMLSEANAILEKKAINRADKGFLSNIIHRAKRFFDDHAPFASDQFERATDKLTTQAKTEIEDFMNMALQRAGVKALAEAEGSPAILMLPESKQE